MFLDGFGMKNILKILLGFHIFFPIRKIWKLYDLLLNKLNGVGNFHHFGELISCCTYSRRQRCSGRDKNKIIGAGQVALTINTILEQNIETSKNICIAIYHFGNIGSIQIWGFLFVRIAWRTTSTRSEVWSIGIFFLPMTTVDRSLSTILKVNTFIFTLYGSAIEKLPLRWFLVIWYQTNHTVTNNQNGINITINEINLCWMRILPIPVQPIQTFQSLLIPSKRIK